MLHTFFCGHIFLRETADTTRTVCASCFLTPLHMVTVHRLFLPLRLDFGKLMLIAFLIAFPVGLCGLKWSGWWVYSHVSNTRLHRNVSVYGEKPVSCHL